MLFPRNLVAFTIHTMNWLPCGQPDLHTQEDPILCTLDTPGCSSILWAWFATGRAQLVPLKWLPQYVNCGQSTWMGQVRVKWQHPLCDWPELHDPGLCYVSERRGPLGRTLSADGVVGGAKPCMPTDWCTSAPNDDEAALMKGVCFTAGQEDMDVVKLALVKLQGNVLYLDEARNPSFW